MTDQSGEKTKLEKSRNIIAQLKEMDHYAKANIEKLTEFWLLLEGEMKQKQLAKKLEALLTHQNAFHDALAVLVKDYEAECERLEKGGS
ncbi:MAG: hypothetical protein OEO84_00520 [Betaproteobacteria bacterium]|nr:hypothetical protein [Betaproteobacteria bacterium]MDH5537185.1 hypothetical protein [Betaproteobacteria bacterium]